MSEGKEDGAAPRRGDENPLARRRAVESRRLRPVVEDAPLPEKVEPAPSRRLNVVKASAVPAPAPAALPRDWLPPRVEDRVARPPTAPTPPTTTAPSTPPLRQAKPPLTLMAVFGALATFGIVASIVGSLPPSLHSRRYDDAQRASLAAAWTSAGQATWGGPVPDQALVAHVGAIAAKVLGPDAKLLVVAADTSAHAFPLPDGTIVVSAALLWRLKSDDELAAVLAHTAAHVRAGHLARTLDGDGVNDDTDDDVADRAVAALAADKRSPDQTALLLGIAERGGTHGYTVADEAVADAETIEMLVAAGVGAAPLLEVVSRFSTDGRVPWARQHTGVSQRRQQLDALALDLSAGDDVTPKPKDMYTPNVLARLDRERPPLAVDSSLDADTTATTPTTATTTTTPTTATTSVTTTPPTAPNAVKRKAKPKRPPKSTKPGTSTKAKGK